MISIGFIFRVGFLKFVVFFFLTSDRNCINQTFSNLEFSEKLFRSLWRKINISVQNLKKKKINGKTSPNFVLLALKLQKKKNKYFVFSGDLAALRRNHVTRTT